MSQLSFNGLAYNDKKKVTHREKFLNEMDKIIPWQKFVSLIEPHYPKNGNGRHPMPLERMLRIYFMQQWFNLSDPGMEDALYDSYSMQHFSGICLGEDPVPDESTILGFRHLLEKHSFTEKMFSMVNKDLTKHGVMMRKGTIMDATIISASNSQKNKEKRRDPEMSAVKKGSNWYFGMKAHVGADSHSGLVHTVVATTAKTHDSKVMEQLLHGEEEVLYGDRAYDDKRRKERFKERGVRCRMTIKRKRGQGELTPQQKRWNKSRSKVRALVEHNFATIKHLWGHRKVRYRGIYKNQVQLFALFMLSNLYKAKKVFLET